MELAFSSNKMQYMKKTFCEVRHQEETAEVIVPDSYPDVASISDCFASVFLRGKECRNGSSTISGAVKAGALYIPEDDSYPRLLEFYMPFTVRFDSASISDLSQIIAALRICSADARMINSRKVMLRANIGCEITAYSSDAVSQYQLQTPDNRLQQKKHAIMVCLPVEVGERSFVVGDSLEIPGSRPPVVQICKVSCRCEMTDQKLIGNKAIFKGMLHCRLLYRSDNDSYYVWSQQLPFSQYCELQGDYDEDELAVHLLLTGCDADLESSGATNNVHLTANILAQCVVSSSFGMELTEDAYCVNGELKSEWAQYELECRLDYKQEQLQVRHILQGDLHEVLDAEVYEGFPSWQRRDQQIEASVPVHIRVCGVDEEGKLISLQGRSDMTVQYPLSDSASCSMALRQTGACTAQNAGGGIEVRCGIGADISFTAAQNFRTLCGGSIEEPVAVNQRKPSVVLRAMGQNQPLWDIAKSFGTTVGALQRANGIDTEYTQEHGMLLIPVE